MGGAWNASIVAEFIQYRGQTLATTGLGAAISQATERGDFHVLAAAVGLMAVTVVGFNRLVWRPLSHRAQMRGLFTRELTRQLESFSVVFLLPMYARGGLNHPQGRGLFSTANPRVARGLMTGLVMPVKPE